MATKRHKRLKRKINKYQNLSQPLVLLFSKALFCAFCAFLWPYPYNSKYSFALSTKGRVTYNQISPTSITAVIGDSF
jgi:hypothetical protein